MGPRLVLHWPRNRWAFSAFLAGDPFHYDRFGDSLLQKPDGPALPQVPGKSLSPILRKGGGLAKEGH